MKRKKAAAHIAGDPTVAPFRAWRSSGVAIAQRPGGAGGIRTLGTRKRTHDFQSCTFSHSVTAPD